MVAELTQVNLLR
jgi:hypothetical protein